MATSDEQRAAAFNAELDKWPDEKASEARSTKAWFWFRAGWTAQQAPQARADEPLPVGCRKWSGSQCPLAANPQQITGESE